MMGPSGRSSRRAGFTLLEVMIASSILVVVGIGLSQGLKIAGESHETVFTTAKSNENLRGASKVLREELKSSGEAQISVTQANGANDVLRFMVPIDNGANPGWGAYERRLGNTEDSWSEDGWSMRYQVEPSVSGGESLMRQVLDVNGVVQFEEELVTEVRPGDHPDGKGFSVDLVGDVWVVILATEEEEGHGKRTETMHVRTRN